MLQNKALNNKEAYGLVCPHKHVSVISQVKKRLESDVLNVILISSITDSNELHHHSDFVCQKNLFLGRILISRGFLEEAMQLLLSTSREAEKSELHDIKFHCDDILRSTYIDGDFGETADQFKESADASLENLSGYRRAKSINYPFMYGRSFSVPPESFNMDLEKLTVNIKKSTSRITAYWYYLALIHYYIQKQEYDQARCCSIFLLHKSLANNDMSSAFEKSEFYLQLSRILIYLKEPNDAIQAARSCIENLPPGIPEFSLPFQMLLRGYLRVNNLEKAMEITDRALKFSNGQHNSSFNIWYLFKSNIFFCLKRYRESNQVLITNDQGFGDNILQRTYHLLYEMVNIIELGDLYWFEYKFDSFRKRIQRLQIREADRIRYLYDLLNLLKKNMYHLEKVTREQRENPVPAKYSPSTAWDPLGFEVINIEEWLLNKLQLLKFA